MADIKIRIPKFLKLDTFTDERNPRKILSSGFGGLKPAEGEVGKLYGLDEQSLGGHLAAKICGEITELSLGEPEADGTIWVDALATIMPDDFGIRMANLIDRKLLRGVSADLNDDYVVSYAEKYDSETSTWTYETTFEECSVKGGTICENPAFADAYVELIDPLPDEYKLSSDREVADANAKMASECEDCDKEVAPCTTCSSFEQEHEALIKASRLVTSFARVREDFTPPEVYRYPKALFAKPDLRRPTPFQYDPSTGRVFGHLAGWNSCHGALPGCVRPPKSTTGYRHFANVPIVTENDEQVWVGRLVCDTVHAKTTGIAAEAAMAHYHTTGAVFALVAIGEDEHGIWISGAAAPTLDKERLTVALACPPSGDWRFLPGMRNRELIAGLAVPVPGFNTPQAEFSAQSGLIVSNIAAEAQGGGALTPDVLTKLDKIFTFVERKAAEETALMAQEAAADRRRRVLELAGAFGAA